MTLEKGKTIVIIKNVPAEVSTTCRLSIFLLK